MYKNKQGKKVTGHPAGLARPASVGKLPVIRYLRTGSGLVPPAPVVRTLTQNQTLNALNAGQCQPEQGQHSVDRKPHLISCTGSKTPRQHTQSTKGIWPAHLEERHGWHPH